MRCGGHARNYEKSDDAGRGAGRAGEDGVTVAQLVAVLSTCDPHAIVFVDQDNDESPSVEIQSVIRAADGVWLAAGDPDRLVMQ